MARKYFGTDGIRGRANAKITAEVAMKVGQAAGLAFHRGDHRHRVVIGKDTRLSSYMIEYALVAGFTSVGVDVLLLGPVPTPGGRDADALDALRSRRDDLGLAQPLRGQRHQAVRPRRLQAVGRGRGADRGADGRRRRADARPLARPRPRQAHRRRPGPLHRIRQADAQPRRLARGPARRRRLRQRRRLQGRARGAVGARRRGDPDRRRAERPQHQSRRRLDRARGAGAQGARNAGRRRHRARRRRRPDDHRRREGPRRRRRPGDGGHRRELARRRPACRSPASSRR